MELEVGRMFDIVKLKDRPNVEDETDPVQVSPAGQHPYLPFVSSQQTSPAEQLPEPSGQHVSPDHMHPVPQGSLPTLSQEAGRLEPVGAEVVAAAAVWVVATPVGDETAPVTELRVTAQLPSQIFPKGQQQGVPSLPVVQYSETLQPPCWSGQQMEPIDMQYWPQTVSPMGQLDCRRRMCLLFGFGEVRRVAPPKRGRRAQNTRECIAAWSPF